VIKVTMFACNIRDGKLLSTPEVLTPYWQKYAIPSMPSPLEYLSYLFFFPTFLAGPAFHFSTYKQFIEGTLYMDKVHNKSGKEPSPILATLRTVGEAILSLVVHIGFGLFFPIAPLFRRGGLNHLNIFSRLLYLVIASLGVKCQYYFAWKLSEGAGIISGLGFNGWNKDGTALFDRLCNIYVRNVELAGSVRDLTIYWNYATGEWLKNYVYNRQAESVQARVPTWAMYFTNIVSAFWHGFYPGYYVAFAKASFEIDTYRQLRARFRPLFVKEGDVGIYPQKYLYDFTGWLLQCISFNFGVAFFVGLSFEHAWILLLNYYFLPIAAPVALYLLVSVLPKTKKCKRQAEKDGLDRI